MIIETKRLILRTIEQSDSEMYLQYLIRNRKFLEEWEPKREESDYSIEKIESQINDETIKMLDKKSYLFLILNKMCGEIIGTIKISNIILGPFMSCYLGYKLSDAYINNGFMTEAVLAIKDYCFKDLGLHRIEANVMPRNVRSQKVLMKAGFAYEGISKKYLKINGVWEDHEHYVILNED